jgi:hypothetical protein
MIEAGQLRLWTYAGRDHGKLFLVLEHSPFSLLAGVNDDGWTIMESDGELCWEVTEHIEESSEEVSCD